MFFQVLVPRVCPVRHSLLTRRTRQRHRTLKPFVQTAFAKDVFIIAQRHHRRLAKIRAYLARELVDVVREDVSQRKSASHHFFLCVLCVLFLLGTRARAHLTKRGTFFFSSIIDAHHVAKKRQKRQNWLSKAMKNVLSNDLLREGERKKQRLVAPEKKKKPPRAKARKNERYEEHARIPSFSSRGELHDEPYIEANVRAFARSRHHLKGGVRFFYFILRMRALFFSFLSLFFCGEKMERRNINARSSPPPRARTRKCLARNDSRFARSGRA